jgi:translation initiation factor IF-2
VLREKEVEEKRKHDEVLKQQQVVKARAVIAGPVQVGKIDLNPKKAAAVSAS